MAFNHQQYNAQYLLNIRNNDEVINDAAQKYGVRIVPADVAEGETYWRIIGIHHLLPRENFSKHSVFIEALDEEGRRIKNPHPWAGWTWEGRRPHERAESVPLDKPVTEPAGNIAMHFGQVVSVWIKGLTRDGEMPSDRAENLHTAHPDEPTPDGALLNTLGHHSFFVVFQRTRKATSTAEGVISGRVERGQGQTVRITKSGEPVAEQVIDQTLTFRFENLPTGLYRLEIVGTNITQENISLTSDNQTIHLELAIPIPDDSLIFGRVKNGQGKTVLLIKEGNIISRFQVPLSENYQFSDLAAGVYSLQIFQTNIRQDNIVLDGANRREINLVIPDSSEPAVEKRINHYLLLGPSAGQGRQLNLLLALDYVLAFSITVGFNIEEAKRARQVTIIGAGISAADQQAIKDSGSQLEVLAGDAYDIAAQLKARIQAGRAFGG